MGDMKVTRYDNQIISQIEYFDFLINNMTVENLIHGHVALADDWIHENISSPFHRLYFILQGGGRIENAEKSISLMPGRIYLIPANSTWSYYCDQQMEQFFIHLKVSLMKGVDVFDQCRDCLTLNDQAEDIRNIIRSAESGSLDSIVTFKSKLFQIIARFIEKYGVDLKSHIERVVKYESLFRYINENASAELLVSDVVDYMNSSQSSLYKNLKEDTGYSIKSYMDKSLISSAQEYLLLTEYSVKKIAFLLKFKDQYYFSRFFKKKTGQPPSQYRSYNKSSI